MAVTSESSTVTKFPLRTFNTGPGFLPIREQLGKKSARERLAESRSKFVRRGSRDELEDNQGDENQRTPGHVFRAVPYVHEGDREPQPVKKSRPRAPPPIPDKPPQVKLMRGVRKGSRDRTLEIVEASLRGSLSQSSDEVTSSSQGVVSNTGSSHSDSPPENLSGGSRVRKLKEQYLNILCADSRSEVSQGQASPAEFQKSDSSSSSPVLLKGNLPSYLKDSHTTAFKAPSEADAIEPEEVLSHPGHSCSGEPKLHERGNAQVVDTLRTLGTSSEKEHSLKSDLGMVSNAKHPSSFVSPDDQTRRQMERFKARYATDLANENGQERKISKITLRPPGQAAERKVRSASVEEPPWQTSSRAVRPRSYTSEGESGDQPMEVACEQDTFSRPCMPPFELSSEGDKKRTEKMRKDTTSQKFVSTSHGESFSAERFDPDISRPMTSDDVRRLRRTKEFNVSGKSPERWGELEETSKNQRSVLEHAVHHGGDRVLGQVIGSIYPSKHYVSKKAFQSRLQPQDSPQIDSKEEIIHRRAKSDLDHSDTVLGSSEEEANFCRPRHRSQDDRLQQDTILPQPTKKDIAQSILFKYTTTSPVKKRSWAPVNFGQNQIRSDANKMEAQVSLSQNQRALSPDICIAGEIGTELQTPQSYGLQQSTATKMSPEDGHERAKSLVQSFLSGVMSSPRGGEISLSPAKGDTNRAGQPHNDGNGNRISSESSENRTLSDDKIHTVGTHWAFPVEISDDVNLNTYEDNETDYEVQVVSKDVQLHGPVPDARERGSISNRTEMQGKAEHGRKYSEQSVEGSRCSELDKRRRLSHNSATSSSKKDDGKDKSTPDTEPQQVKTMSLSDLGKNATRRRANGTGVADKIDLFRSTEVTSTNHNETYSKWSAPANPNRARGEESETDSDEAELRRSKVLRVKKPQRQADQKKEDDKALQNLLSRIINPDDELNTLKRGQKLHVKALEIPVQQVTHKSSSSSSSEGSEDKACRKRILAAQKKPVPKIYNVNLHASIHRPLPNFDSRQNRNIQAAHREGPTSRPAPLSSPTRWEFLRRRSKSDLGVTSPSCSLSSAPSEVERFFNQMGLSESFLQSPLSPLLYSDEDEVFHDMHEYKHTREEDDDEGGNFSTENSDNISQGSKVSEEGLGLAKKLPDTTQSIITKNARVIKWLCQMRKARAASIS
ncbi:uncharacterized protein LOC110978760 [Acanthaster planci]|uniref:Uncharacterized protein LOC110978760 n=1 Tax=Acanthaster planci TaxID=133434 RepID=A0A8B7Y900_ACAPL|nr:uncharacterized protein LOC110978760 [Acanthaster planci]